MTGQSADAQSVREFFETMSTGEVAGGADLFHDPFLSLDPSSVTVVGREQLRAALPAREGLFSSVGASQPELTDLQTTVLDDQHVLARTVWTMHVNRPGSPPLALDSTYLLRRNGTSWTAVVYLNHQDVRQLLAARQDQTS